MTYRYAQLASKNASFHGRECPECGERDSHDDNGKRGSERSYCCAACGTHWDAEIYALTEEEFEFMRASSGVEA